MMTKETVVFVGAALTYLIALGIAAFSDPRTSSDIYPLSWSAMLAVTILAFYVLRSKKPLDEHSKDETHQEATPQQPRSEA